MAKASTTKKVRSFQRKKHVRSTGNVSAKTKAKTTAKTASKTTTKSSKTEAKKNSKVKAPVTEGIEKIGLVTSKSVFKCTGKNWDEWVELLDKCGARNWIHKDIALFLKKKHRLTPWWQQGVTIGYENAIGRRMEGQNQKGLFSTVATRTVSLSSSVVWDFLWSTEGLAFWLKPMSDLTLKKGEVYETEGGIFGEVRTFKPGVRARLTWQEADWVKPSIIQVMAHGFKPGKCMLIVQHEQLANGRLRLQMREHWKMILDEVQAHLRGSGI